MEKLNNRNHHEGTWSINNGERVEDALKRALTEGFQVGRIWDVLELKSYQSISSTEIEFTGRVSQNIKHVPNYRSYITCEPGQGDVEFSFVGVAKLKCAFISSMSATPVEMFRSALLIQYKEYKPRCEPGECVSSICAGEEMDTDYAPCRTCGHPVDRRG